MGEVGLEPTRPCGHQILSLTSLPIPSLTQTPFYTEREKRGGLSVPRQTPLARRVTTNVFVLPYVPILMTQAILLFS